MSSVTTTNTTTNPTTPTSVELDRVSLLYATNSIRNIFGADFGPCYGEFFCSHGRIRGTLYVVTNGILFYSNLLGFERRLCLQYIDMSTLVLHRTTSIRIEITNYDTYILRSFYDRVQVLQLIKRLKELAENNRNRLNQSERCDEGRCISNFEKQYQQIYENSNGHFNTCSPKSQLSFHSLHTSFNASNVEYGRTERVVSLSNRPRAVSDSIVEQQHIQQDDSQQLCHLNDSFESEDQPVNDLSAPPIQETWKETSKSIASLKEAGIVGLRLQCSLDNFYHFFLKDEASYSFEIYQKEYVCDRDVTLTKWQQCRSPTEQKQIDANRNLTHQARILSFIHPIKNAMGIGPTEAKTTRKQQLRRFQQLGIILENQTVVEGIPAADSFSVNDYWRIEADGADHVILSMRFDVQFTKRTLLKNIIEKSILKETRSWLEGYSAMIQDALAKGNGLLTEKENIISTNMAETGGLKRDNENNYRLGFILLCILLSISITLFIELVILHRVMTNIRYELKLLEALRVSTGTMLQCQI